MEAVITGTGSEGASAAAPGRQPLRRLLLRALALQVALVAAAGLIGAAALVAVRHTAEHASATLAPASEAEARGREAMIDMETGLRGWLLTGNRDFLAPYTSGRGAYDDAQRQLAALPLDPRLSGLVARSQDVARRWQQDFAEPALARGVGGTDDAAQARGKADFDAFRAASDAVQTAVDSERLDARRRLRVLLTAGLVAVVLAVVLALLAALRAAGRLERSFVGPVEAVRAQLARLRDGAPGQGVEPRGPDELADLAVSYNALARESERRRVAREEERRLREAGQRVVRRVRRHLELEAVARAAVQALGEELDLAAARLVLRPDPRRPDPAVPGPHLLDVRWPQVEDGPGAPTPGGGGPGAADELAGVSDLVLEHALDRGEPLAATADAGLLRVPVGAGGRPLGLLALHRRPDSGPDSRPDSTAWPLSEVLTVQLVAQELGRAVEHARLYRAQQALAERLGELDRARTDFVATVGHELRNPLFAVSGYAQLLGTTDLDEQQRDWLAVMRRGLEQAGALLDDLRDYSRGAPEGPVHDVELDLAGVVDDAVEAVRGQAVTRGLSLVRHRGPAPVTVRGDRGQLERAVANLLSNAVKYTPTGGRVDVRCVRDPRGCHVVVEDTGIGVPDSDRGRLFTRFYRAGNARDLGSPGTGLGLVVVKAVAERHGGDVALTSQEGVGTRVVLSLPAAARAEAAGE